MIYRITPNTAVRGLCLSLAFIVSSSFARADSMPPISDGPYAVGTTRFVLAEEFGQVGDDEIEGWMAGEADDPAFIRGRLDESVKFGVVSVSVPDEPKRYGSYAGVRFESVYYVSYPTDPSNPREDYTFPFEQGDSVFERMQGLGEEPIFEDANAKYPLVLVSHGAFSHSLWDLPVTKNYARHGYVSVGIFYGDGRFRRRFKKPLDRMALRTLTTTAVLDDILASPFGDHIDVNRIGIVGNSLGAATTMTLLGGRVSSKEISLEDPRISAGVGVVPWAGSGTTYLFGRGNKGAAGVNDPFMAIYGTRDKRAPSSHSLSALRKMSGSTYAVALNKAKHLLTPEENADSMNWQLLFSMRI